MKEWEKFVEAVQPERYEEFLAEARDESIERVCQRDYHSLSEGMHQKLYENYTSRGFWSRVFGRGCLSEKNLRAIVNNMRSEDFENLEIIPGMPNSVHFDEADCMRFIKEHYMLMDKDEFIIGLTHYMDFRNKYNCLVADKKAVDETQEYLANKKWYRQAKAASFKIENNGMKMHTDFNTAEQIAQINIKDSLSLDKAAAKYGYMYITSMNAIHYDTKYEPDAEKLSDVSYKSLQEGIYQERITDSITSLRNLSRDLNTNYISGRISEISDSLHSSILRGDYKPIDPIAIDCDLNYKNIEDDGYEMNAKLSGLGKKLVFDCTIAAYPEHLHKVEDIVLQNGRME